MATRRIHPPSAAPRGRDRGDGDDDDLFVVSVVLFVEEVVLPGDSTLDDGWIVLFEFLSLSFDNTEVLPRADLVMMIEMIDGKRAEGSSTVAAPLSSVKKAVLPVAGGDMSLRASCQLAWAHHHHHHHQ